MVTIVFLIGAINLGLGFALAVLLEHPIKGPSLRAVRRLLRQRAARSTRSNPQPAPPESPQAAEAPPAPAVQTERAAHSPDLPLVPFNEFPWLFPEWAELLNQRKIPVASFPEALLWVASIKLADYCDQLRQCELQTRHGNVEKPLADLRAICAELRTQFADWNTAIQNSEQRQSHGEQLERIDQWLQEPAQQFQRVEQLGHPIDPEGVAELDGSSLRQHLLPIFAHLRGLRDQCDESLAKWLREQKRFGKQPAARLIYPDSKVLTRLGLESTLYEWLEKDLDRVRMASAMLVDIDHCAQLNERHGLALTESILSASLQLLSELVRKDRGFDRVAHFTGSTFLVFLGDTALRNAMVGAERVRQNIGAASFLLGETRVAITASCAVAEWNALEAFDQTAERLRVGLKEAKAAGRNCTVVCGPEENRVAPSSPMTVTAREFIVEPSGFKQK